MAGLVEWRWLVGDSDDDQEFEGFTAADLVKVERPNRDESDLDLDWSDIDQMFDSSSSDESDDEGERHKTGGEWSSTLHSFPTAPFCEPSGPVHNLPVGATPIEFLNQLLPDSFYDTLACQTNLYAEQIERESGKKDKKWRPVSPEEIKLYVAICIMMGIHKLPRQKHYWSENDKLNVEVVSKLLSQNRFAKIQQYLHLSDKTKCIPHGEPGHDPLFKIRPLMDIVKHSFSEHYRPGREISIDEAMIKYNGRLYFKQYIRNKPTPWGVKVWCCCDPRNGYLLDFEVYTGKKDKQAPEKGVHVFNSFMLLSGI